MYWDDRVQAKAIQTMLSQSGTYMFRKTIFFENDKATPAFWETYENRGVLAQGEQVMMSVALDLWNGQAHTDFTELYYLDAPARQLVFSLYMALCKSEEAVLQWIEEVSKIDPDEEMRKWSGIDAINFGEDEDPRS
jgi:hypothetical protein